MKTQTHDTISNNISQGAKASQQVTRLRATLSGGQPVLRGCEKPIGQNNPIGSCQPPKLD
jgi:hypothetical protein